MGDGESVDETKECWLWNVSCALALPSLPEQTVVHSDTLGRMFYRYSNKSTV